MSSSLADYFRSQAAWREEKAKQYHEDERNAQSAEALRSLAVFVESDERAEEAEQELEPYLLNGRLGGEATRREVASYGYGYRVNAAQHVDFLGGLVALCFEDAYDAVGEAADGKDATGQLLGFEVEAAREGIAPGPHYWRLRNGRHPRELEKWLDEARAEAGNELPGGTPDREAGE